MNVFTYHEPVPGMREAAGLLELWAETWGDQGWVPCILNESDARRHPDFERYHKRISRFPHITPPGYDRACFLRHMAMAAAGGGLLVDYDVINRSFKPDDLSMLVEGRTDYVLLLEPTRVPCAVAGDRMGFFTLCNYLSNYEVQPDDRENGEPHVSDMHILRKSKVPATSVVVEYLCSGRPVKDDPGDGWKKAPLIHFSRYSFLRLGIKGVPKEESIREVLKGL